MKTFIKLITLCAIFTAASVNADWSFKADGVTFDVDSNGEINRIYAKHTESVSFPDRKGINTATTIAEERAKARIVRFINESVSDETVVTELETEAQTALAQSGGNRSGEGTRLSRESVRSTLRSIQRMTRSAAKGNLRGVVRLEQSYDPEDESVYVVVGISQKSMSMSRGLEGFLNEGAAVGPQDNDSESPGAILPDGEKKTISDEDW